jgi:ADP-ribosylglycohydrolase
MVYASFAADSLALAAHWIYDQDELRQSFGRITELAAPPAGSYHPGKTRGEQTHYGDQALVLLRSFAESGGYDEADFTSRWRAMWDGYPDYFDHATRETLARIDAGGGGSASEELGGAARIAALLWRLANEPLPVKIAAARSQTSVTHDSPIALDAAEFLARVVHGILNGAEIWPAVEGAVEGDYAVLIPAEILRKVDQVKHLDAAAAADHLGLACPVATALPTVLALLQRYPDDLENALIENVMAGGDSAARGLALGMILGARHGKAAVPQRWIEGLKCAPEIDSFVGGA